MIIHIASIREYDHAFCEIENSENADDVARDHCNDGSPVYKASLNPHERMMENGTHESTQHPGKQEPACCQVLEARAQVEPVFREQISQVRPASTRQRTALLSTTAISA